MIESAKSTGRAIPLSSSTQTVSPGPGGRSTAKPNPRNVWPSWARAMLDWSASKQGPANTPYRAFNRPDRVNTLSLRLAMTMDP